jgi:hypothetical protein
MIVRLLTFVTLASLAIAQAPGPAPGSVPDAPDTTVLTIHGICSQRQNPPSPNEQNCSVEIRMKQFEELIKAAAPGAQVTPELKRNVAKTYAELLAFQTATEKAGIDNSAQLEASLEWLGLRTMADFYRHSLEKQLTAPSDQEVDTYYRQNASQFEEVGLLRMLLPKNNFAITDKREFEKKALEIATEFRDRAAKKEDMDQLQKEAYTAAGFHSPPPATSVGTRRRSGLPSDVSDDVFALQPGQVTKVEDEPYSFVIYKVDSKRMLPKELAREEIVREIVKQKRDAALKAVTEGVHAELDEKYFGPPTEQ